MIRFEQVTFRYGKRVVLDGLSFTAEPGQCTVLAGPNGIGKSTALALAAGALKPHSGTIHRSGSIGYAPQDAVLFPDLSVRDNLRFFASARSVKIPAEPFLPLEASRKHVGKLSGGMQKRVSLVCASLGDPQILLLDEPCIGLDMQAQQLLFERIATWKQEGRCILYVGHNPEEIEAVADRLVLLGQGCSRTVDRKTVPALGALLRQWITENT